MDVDRQTAFALGLRRPSASLLPPHTNVEHEPHPFVASLADTLHSLPGTPLAGDAIVLSAAEVLRLPEGAVGREEALQRTATALARSRTASALDLAHVCFALGALCHDSGRLAESAGWYRKSAHAVEARLGPNHAALVAPLHNEGIALARLGRFDDARAALGRAADLAGSVLGVGGLHALRADLVAGIAASHQAEADGGAAEQAYARAVSIVGEVPAAAAAPHFCRVGLAELLQQAGGEKTRRDRTADHERAFDLLGAQRAALRAALASSEAPATEAARLSDELAHCAGRAALSAFALRRPVDAAAALAEVLAATGGKGDGARAAREVLATFCNSSSSPFTLQSASNGASPSAAADGPAAPLSFTE